MKKKIEIWMEHRNTVGEFKTHPEDWTDMVKDEGTLHHISICVEPDGIYLRPAYTVPQKKE